MSVTEIPVEDMIRLLCEHALVTEYATNPIGNLALRLFRDHLVEVGGIKLGDLEEFMQTCPESIIPGIITVAKKSVQAGLIKTYFADLGKESYMKDKLICDYLQMKYEDDRLDEIIKDEAFAPAINAQPL